MRQLKRSWRLTWSPGRIVVAGLLAYGFLSHCVYGLTTEFVRKSLRAR